MSSDYLKVCWKAIKCKVQNVLGFIFVDNMSPFIAETEGGDRKLEYNIYRKKYTENTVVVYKSFMLNRMFCMYN